MFAFVIVLYVLLAKTTFSEYIRYVTINFLAGGYLYLYHIFNLSHILEFAVKRYTNNSYSEDTCYYLNSDFVNGYVN